MESFHGTSSRFAIKLASGGVDVSIGGGELGRGFYSGEYLHVAKAWAFNIHRSMKQNVVMFKTDDNDVNNLSFDILDAPTARAHRNNIRSSGKVRTHLFGLDMVWAPIVGKETITCDQFKWESLTAQSYLNSSAVPRIIF
jgi:hypothetical protein